MKSLIYLHGFNSSPASKKAQFIQSWCKKAAINVDLQIPLLAFAPQEAIAQIDNLIVDAPNTVLIGSSLGGYYANYFAEKYAVKAVLINPAVRPYELLGDYLGEQLNPYTGESYFLAAEHMQQLRAVAVHKMQRASNRMVLLQTGDETLDYRQAESYFANAVLEVEQGGDHSFVGFENKLEQIANFLDLK